MIMTAIAYSTRGTTKTSVKPWWAILLLACWSSWTHSLPQGGNHSLQRPRLSLRMWCRPQSLEIQQKFGHRLDVIGTQIRLICWNVQKPNDRLGQKFPPFHPVSTRCTFVILLILRIECAEQITHRFLSTVESRLQLAPRKRRGIPS